MRSLFILLVLTGPAAADRIAENLDRAAISDGIAKVKSKIVACGEKSSATGTVKVKVTVASDGKVTSATADQTPDAALGDCVVAVIKAATFQPTVKGGSFGYPFVFNGKPAGKPAEKPDPPTTDPDGLDRAAISEGIAKVKSDIAACAGKVKGTVKVKVDVRPSGSVAFVKVTETPDPGLAGCVSGKISKATFKKTAKGGSFTYPFVF